MNKNFFFKYAVFGFMVLIIMVSSIPGKSLPKIVILSPDKLLHLTEYTMLAIFAKLRFHQFNYKIIGSLILFAVLDECWQLMIPGRSSSIYDIVADILGIFIVVSIVNFRAKKSND